MPRPEDIVFPRRRERTEDRRTERQSRKLVDEFFDHPTLLAISRLVSQGQFEAIDFPISVGKEGGVFRAGGPGGLRAVKIYRIGNTIFRRLPPYLMEVLRRESSARNFKGLIFAWTRREHTILRRLRGGGVSAPEPYGYVRNVLVMEFIGTDGAAAPRLKDAVMEDPALVYQNLVTEIRRMNEKVKLVHGDLSPYNVLLVGNSPVLIDVAQSISREHPQASTLLHRDIQNFSTFFQRAGVEVKPESFLEAVGADQVGPPR